MCKQSSMIRITFLIIALVALAACGKVNSDAPPVDSNGKHPVDWIGQHKNVARVSTSTCSQCHGSDLTGGITQIGCFSTTQKSVSGFACHATSPAANPTGCVSCHSLPPNGTTAPNRANAHAKHLALFGLTCDSCHSGGGSGTVNHAKGVAAVSLPVTLKAKSITTSFGYDATSGKCSGIICHGGQPTPIWSGGIINVATDCLKCHEQGSASQAPQYNSFYSGQWSFNGSSSVNLHKLHLLSTDTKTTPATPIVCINCHNISALAAKHFIGLTTSDFEGAPTGTIGGGTTKITGYISGTCATSCHVDRKWLN